MKTAPVPYLEKPEVLLGNIKKIDIPELKIQYDRSSSEKFKKKITCSRDAAEFLQMVFPKWELELQEQFIILFLDRKNAILGYYRHSKGGITSTIVDVRLIFAVALKAGATGMVLSHNHPSGNTSPSIEDKLITEKIKTAAQLLDITLTDHVIVTKNSYYSFMDEGILGELSGIKNNSLPENHEQFIIEVKRRIFLGTQGNKKTMEKLGASLNISDKTTIKELIELAIVETARTISLDKDLSIGERYKQIVKLYESQVNLSHRTSQSILLQQYSTPAPIGFLAGIFCEIDKFAGANKLGFEPSAGNGLLTIASYPDDFIVNEIDKTRNTHLQTQGFEKVLKKDATLSFTEYEKKFDAVITNPPFGKASNVIEFDGYPISTLEHLMAIRALNTMKDNGRAAIIIGNHTFYDEKGRVQGGAQRVFLNYLYNHYYVADIIPINGAKLYSRQGTSFDTRLILIDGRKEKPSGAAPVFVPTDNKIYLHDGKEYSASELIDFASASSEYDRRDAGEDTTSITTVKQAIKWLEDVEVKKETHHSANKKEYTYRETPVYRFDELFDRVTEAMKYSHRSTYKEIEVPSDHKKNEPMRNVNPEVNLAFQAYWKFKGKYSDSVPLVAMGESYYTFNLDAFLLNEIIGLGLNSFTQNKTPEPYVKFPRERIDLYLNKIVKNGKRVAIIEELQNPKPKSNKQTGSLEELERDLEAELNRLKNGEGEQDLGAPYLPASESCVVLNTVVPDSMEYETKEALQLIQSEVGGNVDEFVRQRLGYSSKLELCKALSAEQTDAVAMAIYNIEAREQGMIIGDQTGIGKGRVAAAMIRYAVLQGHKPIFITEKPSLFSDIYRDLIAIGSGHLVPFIVNGRESKTDIKDENGEILFQAAPHTEQQAFFEDKKIPGYADMVLATYSQFNSPDKKPAKPQFLLEIAQGNVLILDESHNASGSSNVGEYLQAVLAKSKGVVFLSATFAKRPDNMPIYAMKTAISDANMTKDELVSAIIKGGVALQEVLASQLVKEGQMLRRERSFEGIEVNYITLDELETEHKAIADNVTEVLRGIIAFQTNSVDEMVDELDEIAVAEGKEVKIREGTSQAGVDNLPYFSKVFNVINQMLFSIKAEAVADRAIVRLKEGKKPVIAFASTMGSFIEGMENESGLPVADGDTVNADFAEVLMRGLDGVLRYTVTTPEGKKEFKKFDLTQFGVEARTEYLRLASIIKEMSSGISISPIDIIVQKLSSAGYRVAEVTGRKYELQINRKTNKGLVRTRNKVNTNDAFRQFNNNEIDVLLINQSGSTGSSAHAIVTKNVPASEVKQRVMLVLQAELNINTEVQKRGRVNRTGQILLPIYDYINSAIPAEKRLMMMAQKKLKSLDANTTSNQKQSTKILDVPDFLNKYGDKIVTQYLMDNADINKLLGDPLGLADTSNEKGEILEEAAHKVSGRVAVLSTKMQSEFYNEIAQNYIEYVEYLKQIGEYDLEVEAMNLESETLSEKVVKMGKGGDSEFGTDSILEKIEATVLRKPFTKTELANILKESLDNKDAHDIQKSILKDYDHFTENFLKQELEDTETHYAELIKAIPDEKKGLKIKEKEGVGAYNKYIHAREVELTDAKGKELVKVNLQVKNRKQYLGGILKFFYVGRNLSYPMSSYGEGDVKIKAVFIGFIIDKKKKNPYAPSNIRLRFGLANSNKYIAMPASYTQDINGIIGASYDVPEKEIEQTLTDWETAIKAIDRNRTIRYVVTGNILQAFADYNGKLVSYTTKNGEVKKGILMPEYWDPNEEMADSVSVPIGRALKVIASSIRGNGLTTANGTAIFNQGDSYKIIVPASKQKGGDVYLNPDILKLVERNNFEKTADKMVAVLPHKHIEQFVQILQNKFSDSVTLTMNQFKLIQDVKSENHVERNKIILLTPEEVEEQEELSLMALNVEVELEMELELMRLQQAA